MPKKTDPQGSPEKSDDLAVIVPTDGVVTVGGVACRVKRMNLLELASLMRVITTGAGPALAAMGNTDDIDTDALTGLILLSLPNAAEEFVEFLRFVLVPDGEVPEGWALNPTPEETLAVLAVLVDQEAEDMQALVGKARQMWEQMIVPLINRSTG